MATPVAWQGIVEQYASRLNRDYAGIENIHMKIIKNRHINGVIGLITKHGFDLNPGAVIISLIVSTSASRRRLILTFFVLLMISQNSFWKLRVKREIQVYPVANLCNVAGRVVFWK